MGALIERAAEASVAAGLRKRAEAAEERCVGACGGALPQAYGCQQECGWLSAGVLLAVRGGMVQRRPPYHPCWVFVG